MTKDVHWDEFVGCMMSLLAVYHDPMATSDEGIQIKFETFWGALQDLKIEQLHYAVRSMIKNRSGFFPTPKEIRDLAYDYVAPVVKDDSVKQLEEAEYLPMEESARRMGELAKTLKEKFDQRRMK